ncbi:conserved hypothetical protein [Desulfamplus magnetovallimortis]|uniref:Arginine dihydrolase ArgZ/ArgE-like C-terminal second subdomain domain-containing protein n=1 Tax=Desulfamplus magnetovallimortis TaxID=1246637 RepID=A0A1W1HAP5_9BACT|nr:hypothetical protein [Desulfamplus magnetovallimortis]SLM29448.1 conserved hypothetical protein [Desulfamplus magnetovallimortis]
MKYHDEIDLTAINTYSARKRTSVVSTSLEASPSRKGISMASFLESLPSLLKAEDLKNIARAIVSAKQSDKPVIVMLGGHVIKTGCSPILSDLARNGFITHFASNGSAAIHDTELARFGHTSEDVSAQLEDGSFGMASDTAALVNGAAVEAYRTKKGFGQTMGAMLKRENPPHAGRALLVTTFELGLPYTLHIAIGTDIVHQHPDADGAAIGEASLRDFRIFAASVAKLGDGGVVLNLGSAVIMPEVFLKAVSVARNLGHDVRNFTTANFDMIQHYRPGINVVTRPVMSGGKGYSITGHHEIMIPLLAAAVYEMAG